jgi:hypothetical protein
VVTLTVTPTVDLTSTPPSVSLAVTDSTGANSSVTITRFTGGGVSNPVRTSDGGPLPLTTSGSTKVGTLIDYEAPYGVPVQYSVDGGATLTAPITVVVTRPWLVHPFTPNLSMQIMLRPGSLNAESRAVVQGVHQPLSRKYPIVVTDGSRKSAQSQMVVLTQGTAQYGAFKALLADASVLLLNIPGSLDWGFSTAYIAILGEHKPSRVADRLAETWRDNTLSFVVVEAPISGTAANTSGGTGGTRTWADLSVERVTWANAETAYSLWSKAEAGTPG